MLNFHYEYLIQIFILENFDSIVICSYQKVMSKNAIKIGGYRVSKMYRGITLMSGRMINYQNHFKFEIDVI